MAKKPTILKTVETLVHDEAKRKNIPTAEHQSVVKQDDKKSIRIKYPRNTDLDPQIVWKGKDEQDWSDLVVNAPPLYIQEKVHPKALIDDLLRKTKEEKQDAVMTTADLFSDFDGIPDDVDKTEFYSHDQNWSNRMILGDSLQVMASLAEREGLRGQVQCIYFDPPYGIKFNSNFQWSTTSRDVKDGNSTHITREPEQVKAFRDTWRYGVNSFLTYLRDRLTVARDLLCQSGSIFVQISDENVHRVRGLMDEVFGEDNFIAEILVKKTGSQKSKTINSVNDYILFYSKSLEHHKFRKLYERRELDSDVIQEFSYAELNDSDKSINLKKHIDINGDVVDYRLFPKRIQQDFPDSKIYRTWSIMSSGERPRQMAPIEVNGEKVSPSKGQCWSHTSLPEENSLNGMERIIQARRLVKLKTTVQYKRYLNDFPYKEISNWWDGFGGASNPIYVVQTNERIVERCILMATDPGDLVLDPTCGSGTTAYVAEQWARRWITIDTSRVALALARTRIMGAKYPFYYLADSHDGNIKEAEISSKPPSNRTLTNNIKYGFVYERHPHVMSSVIANNNEIDAIVEKYKVSIEKCLNDFEAIVGKRFFEWDFPKSKNDSWNTSAKDIHTKLHKLISTKQIEIDKSIFSKAENELLYDKPYEDRKKVRVAGPFTFESLSPHRVVSIDEDDNLIDVFKDIADENPKQSFTNMILETLKTAGVQQAHKDDKIDFTSIARWPGQLICAEGLYIEGGKTSNIEKRSAIFVGPEFGTVQRADLVQAAREAGDAGFDALIACAFNFEAHATELNKLGSIPILKARMNADLHMSEDLRNTGKGNLFVIFGEPDIEVIQNANDSICIKVNGVDVFKPQTGEVVSDGADGIACWFVDTDYNEESFFVRHAYFLGANDPYSSLKTTLKAEINADAWATLNSDTSRPFPKPKSGRIAVKVINHLGDEVMKVFKV